MFKNPEPLVAKSTPCPFDSKSTFIPTWPLILIEFNAFKNLQKYLEGHHRITNILFCQEH